MAGPSGSCTASAGATVWYELGGVYADLRVVVFGIWVGGSRLKGLECGVCVVRIWQSGGNG